MHVSQYALENVVQEIVQATYGNVVCQAKMKRGQDFDQLLQAVSDCLQQLLLQQLLQAVSDKLIFLMT